MESGNNALNVSAVSSSSNYSSLTGFDKVHRKELVFFARMLHKRHYVSGCDGNLSVRLDATRILTTPTGVCKGMLKQEHMVIVDLQGRKLEGSLQPSSELQMHLTIYKQRPDVDAVVHAHPCVATGIACSGMSLSEPICSELVLTLGRIPLAPYAMPGTHALSDALLPYIADHDAILMQNHGVVAYGETLSQAYLNMETVEHSARILLVTKLLGSQKMLAADQVASLLDLQERKRAAAAREKNERRTHSAIRQGVDEIEVAKAFDFNQDHDKSEKSA